MVVFQMPGKTVLHFHEAGCSFGTAPTDLEAFAVITHLDTQHHLALTKCITPKQFMQLAAAEGRPTGRDEPGRLHREGLRQLQRAMAERLH